MADLVDIIEVRNQATNVWTDLSRDLTDDLEIDYGIDGNGPTDCVFRDGSCTFHLDNSLGNSVGVEGRYSKLHANKLTGWEEGILCRVTLKNASTPAKVISSITRVGSTVTVTTIAAHGYSSDDWVRIADCTPTDYNGSWQITVTGGTTFTFTIETTPSTPASAVGTVTLVVIKHYGKIEEIDVDTDPNGDRRVHVTSLDGGRDLIETDVSEVALQVNKTEAELTTAMLDSLPTASQPRARSIETGLDTFPYAFNEIGSGVKAASLLKTICINAFAFAFMKGDGTLVLQNRNTRATGASAYDFSNLRALTLPSSRANLANLFIVTIQPKTTDPAATTVLYRETGTPRSIPANTTIEFFVDYKDPDDLKVFIGGLDVVTPLVAGTHYAANSQIDGLGSNLNAHVSIVPTPWGTRAKIVVTNSGAVPAYLVNGSGEAFLELWGKGVYERSPQHYRAYTAQSYGTRQRNLELNYQSSSEFAQSLATYLEAQYRTLANQINHLEFIANYSEDYMEQMLHREPGDIIRVTNALSGMNLVKTVIHKVGISVSVDRIATVRYGLAPSSPFEFWVSDIVGRSEAGETTIPGL